MKPISKEEFILILERQQRSGLSIKDFCSNESYTESSFYHWKSKFGLLEIENLKKSSDQQLNGTENAKTA